MGKALKEGARGVPCKGDSVMTLSHWMWGTDAERWQKEPRPLTHSNMGLRGKFLPPPPGAIAAFSGRDRGTMPPRTISGRGWGGQETSPKAVEIVLGEGTCWSGGLGSERHGGPLPLLQDSGLVSHREAQYLFH